MSKLIPSILPAITVMAGAAVLATDAADARSRDHTVSQSQRLDEQRDPVKSFWEELQRNGN